MRNTMIQMTTLIFAFIFFTCNKSNTSKVVQGCMDPAATNYNRDANASCSNCCTYPPPKQGGVLFWSGDAALYGSCGLITVSLDNGQQTSINGYYNQIPPDCLNRVGGYILLDVGSYNFNVTFSNPNCTGGSGSITVKEGCNRYRLY